MVLGIPKEILAGEKRVAISPNSVKTLKKIGFDVIVEKRAGIGANFLDADYKDAGATMQTKEYIWENSDVILKVNPPMQIDGALESQNIKENATLISFIWRSQNQELLDKLASKNINVLAMDSIPRISRAQKMDALSSMSNIAGYRAVIEASHAFGRFLGGQITAAGKIPPAKVLIIGAGVAGLSAIGAASSLGAIVRGFDTRLETKEQIESMNAEFLELEFDQDDGAGEGGYAKPMSKEFIDAEMKLFKAQAKEVDIIITTALIPGRPAPKLILKDMVDSMKKGSVIVDLAAEQGGNCEYTKKGKAIEKNGVKIIGYTDLPSRLPQQASRLYSSNITHLISDLVPKKDGNIDLNMKDEVIRGATIIENGEILPPPPPPKLSAAPKNASSKANTMKQDTFSHDTTQAIANKNNSKIYSSIAIIAGALGMVALGNFAPISFLSHFMIFVLSCFIGYQVIWNVTPALHTPLMSVTNAISGIIVLGALMQMTSLDGSVLFLSFTAILIASINIIGGFNVTHRMLKMFTKGGE